MLDWFGTIQEAAIALDDVLSRLNEISGSSPDDARLVVSSARRLLAAQVDVLRGLMQCFDKARERLSEIEREFEKMEVK